jgi:isoleucyl-tRNA synthetase
MSNGYRDTVFLPRTEFPMKAQLPRREPEILARWEEIDLHARLREASKGAEKFILHDGPPYANGHLHIGHALNKILKDVINRAQQMLGKDAHYVPGWDCHGLPIEWQIEQKYRKAGKDKDAVPVVDFREECRAHAAHWIDIQAAEFKRLGVLGDWANPYTTMSFDAEAQIVRELGKFLLDGSLYRGSKPVMWSVVEKTALAEAEIEYEDHTSTTIHVRFPVASSPGGALDGAGVVIWTTTPWTIPANRAVAYNPELDYALIEVAEVSEGSLARVGERLVIASGLVDAVAGEAGFAPKLVSSFSGEGLEGVVCRHPFHGQDYDFEVPLLPGDHVTLEQGTGLVHTAPGHGAEDFVVGQRFGLETPDTVADNGTFYDHVPMFAGQHVFKADGPIAEALEAAGALLTKGRLVHSYPHSWRSKAPLIFRNTPQWFISMESTGLRAKALAAIEAVRWVPSASQARIRAMIETRPDWVLSRQRVWGVPLAVFVDKASGQPLRDGAVIERIAEAVEAEGADVWFTNPSERFLGPDHDPEGFEKVTDILDVWFDSGSTHAFVLESRADLASPASLYLEGSDQHRGWFHSSLLESCGTRGHAPYEAVLTHGFVVDGEGRKMSKSAGNVVSPDTVLEKFGADILRLWVVSADYAEDLRISDDILRYQADAYRRLRNTLRYLLGNLEGFDEVERLDHADFPELERWVCHRLWELDGLVRRAIADYDFHDLYVALHNFCAVELSALYFDIRKDALYCDAPSSTRRRAARSVLDLLFSHLTAWLAPILCFTAEEAWRTRFPDDVSVHLRLFPDVPEAWRDDALAARWARVRDLRRVVTGALEVERREKRIGSSLDAAPTLYAPAADLAAIEGVDFAEIAITSGLTLSSQKPPQGAFALDDVPGIGAVPGPAPGEKCGRCWRVLPEVGQHSEAPDLCGRCVDVLGASDAAAG